MSSSWFYFSRTVLILAWWDVSQCEHLPSLAIKRLDCEVQLLSAASHVSALLLLFLAFSLRPSPECVSVCVYGARDVCVRQDLTTRWGCVSQWKAQLSQFSVRLFVALIVFVDSDKESRYYFIYSLFLAIYSDLLPFFFCHSPQLCQHFWGWFLWLHRLLMECVLVFIPRVFSLAVEPVAGFWNKKSIAVFWLWGKKEGTPLEFPQEFFFPGLLPVRWYCNSRKKKTNLCLKHIYHSW